jgi:hypothetical protein
MGIFATAANPSPTGAAPSGGIFAQARAAQQQTKPQGGVLSSVLNGAASLVNTIEKPFVGLAALPLQAGVAIKNAVTGTHTPDPFAQGIPSYGQTLPVTPLSAEAKLGDAAQVGSYFVPGEGVLGAVGTGILQGAGSAMSDQKDLTDVALQGAMGGAIGGVAGGATKALGSVTSYAGKLINGKAAGEATHGVYDAYSKALNLNATERNFENRSGKDLAQVLINNKAGLSRNADGTLSAADAIPTLKTALAPLDAEAQHVLSSNRATINLVDVATKAKQALQSQSVSALDRTALAQHIDNYVQAEIADRTQSIAKATYGQDFTALSKQQQAKVTFDAANASVVEADKIKSSFWNTVGKGFDRDTVLNENAAYQLGKSTKEAIEQAVPDEQLGQINKERGDLIDAIRRITKLDGNRKVPGGALGSMFGGLTGTLIGGHVGGAPGALLGDYFGTKAANFVNDPANSIGAAQAKKQALGAVPSVLGKTAKPIGNGLETLGSAIKKGARAVGIGANLLTK